MFAVLQQANNNQVTDNRNRQLHFGACESLAGDGQYANGRKHGHATGSANNNIRNNMTSTHQALGITEQWWQKPTRGRLECNIDASFSSSHNNLPF
jgi:hypothetical protein